MRESMPIALFLRNRLNYALNMKEVTSIMKQRLVKIDGKVRTDHRFPAGFMDVVQLAKVNENFRLIYDVKGRFCVHRITGEEAKYKLSASSRCPWPPTTSPCCPPTTDAPSATPTPSARSTIPSEWTSPPTRLWTSSSSSPATSAWSPEALTLDVLESS